MNAQSKQLGIMVAFSVVVLLAGAAQAAVYVNADVTSATLSETDAVNTLDAYTVSGGDYQRPGMDATGVSLRVINGSSISVNDFYLGHNIGSDGNSVLIDNASLTSTYWGSIGASSSKGAQGGDNNSIVIQNGGKLIANSTAGYNYNYIGGDSTTGNSLLVTGAGSQYRAQRVVRIGGTGNTVTVANGALMTVCRLSDNDGAVSVGSGNSLRLAGAYVAVGKSSVSESGIQLWDGSAWADLSGLDAAQRTALGYSETIATDEASFNTLTGGLYTDVAGAIDFTLANAVYVYTGGVAVPEPATMSLVAMGGLALLRRSRGRK